MINDGSLKWEIASSLQFSIIFCEKTIVVYNKLNKHSSEAHVCGSSPLSNKDKQMVVNCWNSCADWFNYWWRNKGVFRKESDKNVPQTGHRNAAICHNLSVLGSGGLHSEESLIWPDHFIHKGSWCSPHSILQLFPFSSILNEIIKCTLVIFTLIERKWGWYALCRPECIEP